jgi:mannosyltransferase OCH1-like enzyme
MNIYILILLIIIIIAILYYDKIPFQILKKDIFYNIPISDKIPLTVYLTWKNKDLPSKMNENIILLKNNNPEFRYYLYDDNDCREFIKNYFTEEVSNTYDKLIPGPFKADLWRYCVLYINGGIYMDIKLNTANNFKLIDLTDKEYFVRDIEYSHSGIYNAFMVCKKGNEKLKKCIERIVKNVQDNYYGWSDLIVTGPLLMKNYFSNEEINNLELFVDSNNDPKNVFISNGKKVILKSYNNYRADVLKNNKIIQDYYYLWLKRKIYN